LLRHLDRCCWCSAKNKGTTFKACRAWWAFDLFSVCLFTTRTCAQVDEWEPEAPIVGVNLERQGNRLDVCACAHVLRAYVLHASKHALHACVASTRVHPYDFPSIQPRRSNLYMYASRHEVTKAYIAKTSCTSALSLYFNIRYLAIQAIPPLRDWVPSVFGKLLFLVSFSLVMVSETQIHLRCTVSN
jgi:hypothetical protein